MPGIVVIGGLQVHSVPCLSNLYSLVKHFNAFLCMGGVNIFAHTTVYGQYLYVTLSMSLHQYEHFKVLSQTVHYFVVIFNCLQNTAVMSILRTVHFSGVFEHSVLRVC